jgi:RNA polymerase sigma-70 factor, ECF subfamily
VSLDRDTGERIGEEPATHEGMTAPALQEDDTRARLAAVYRDHVAFVHRCVRRLGAPDSGVEDVVQDVFVVAARRLHEFEGRADVRTWLFAIAMRVIRHHRRTTWRHLRRKEALAFREAALPSYGETMEARDASALLMRLLDGLDEERRAVFVLMELEGMSAPEVAEALEMNPNTVYTRLRAARKHLSSKAQQLGITKQGAA